MTDEQKTDLRRLLGNLHREQMTAEDLQEALRVTLEVIVGMESHVAANMNRAEEGPSQAEKEAYHATLRDANTRNFGTRG